MSRRIKVPMIKSCHSVFRDKRLLTEWGMHTIAVSSEVRSILIDFYGVFESNNHCCT